MVRLRILLVGKANPSALLQSAVMMLHHIHESDKARAMEQAIFKALQDPQCCTGDLGGRGNTKLFTEAIVQGLKSN